MAKIERFEDISAWQKARQLVKAVYQATNTGKFAQDWPSVSAQAVEVSRMISGFMKYLRQSEMRGSKFK